MKTVRNYLAMAVVGFFAVRFLLTLIAPLVPLLSGLLIVAAVLVWVLGRYRHLR